MKRRETPVVPLPELQLDPQQQFLLDPHPWPSLHETFVILGADRTVLDMLRKAGQAVMDANSWIAALSLQKAAAVKDLRIRWVKELGAYRVSEWLKNHPLVSRLHWQVSIPQELEVDALQGLELTESSGLGVSLAPAQQALLEEARQVLRGAWQMAEDPYALLRLAKQKNIAALLGTDGSEELKGIPQSVRLTLLLGGLRSLDHQACLEGVSLEMEDEFRQAIDEHYRLVETPVPAEGCAIHALLCSEGRRLAGMGTLLAAIAGAAYSPSAVVLRLSKFSGELAEQSQTRALEHLGELLVPSLEDSHGEKGKVLLANIQRILGVKLLKEHREQCRELERATVRLASKKPMFAMELEATAQPDVALVQLHVALVDHAYQQALLAEQRMFQILQALANAGTQGEYRRLAHLRLGYAIVGFGMELIRSSSNTELLSAGREALSRLNVTSFQAVPGENRRGAKNTQLNL
jgi:hypothetical protein